MLVSTRSETKRRAKGTYSSAGALYATSMEKVRKTFGTEKIFGPSVSEIIISV